MEVVRFSETLVHIRTTRHYIPEDGNIHNYHSEILKSFKPFLSLLQNLISLASTECKKLNSILCAKIFRCSFFGGIVTYFSTYSIFFTHVHSQNYEYKINWNKDLHVYRKRICEYAGTCGQQNLNVWECHHA
jgi:hypothetical protein